MGYNRDTSSPLTVKAAQTALVYFLSYQKKQKKTNRNHHNSNSETKYEFKSKSNNLLFPVKIQTMDYLSGTVYKRKHTACFTECPMTSWRTHTDIWLGVRRISAQEKNGQQEGWNNPVNEVNASVIYVLETVNGWRLCVRRQVRASSGKE